MKIFVYLEQGQGDVDGPFASLPSAFMSRLWHEPRACIWRERYEPGKGWRYENAIRHASGWVVTSSALRPLELVRPATLDEFFERKK